VTLLLFAVMLVEWGNVSGSQFGDRNDYNDMAVLRQIQGDQDIAGFLERQPRPFRVDTDTEELGLNWPEYHHFDGLKAALASLTLNATDMEVHIPAVRSLWNITYTIGRQTSLPDAQVIFEGASGRKLFRNPHAFPRAWAVHRIVTVPKVSDGQALIRDHLEDLHSEAIVIGGAPKDWKPAPCDGDNVTVTREGGESMLVRASMACDGIVVLSDLYYPGWKAFVDGKAVDVHQANLAMRAVAVPRGTHQIRYVFRPASAYLGASLTAIGILGAAVSLLRRKAWN